jgi:hypothetical protein
MNALCIIYLLLVHALHFIAITIVLGWRKDILPVVILASYREVSAR